MCDFIVFFLFSSFVRCRMVLSIVVIMISDTLGEEDLLGNLYVILCVCWGRVNYI